MTASSYCFPLQLHCFHSTALFTTLSLSHTLLFLISVGFLANAMPVVTDHVNGHCTSPTSQPCPSGRARVPGGPEGPRLARRGPGRPPFRKAQSAACMEVSLPVSSLTEGVCLFSSSFIPLFHLPFIPVFLHCPIPFCMFNTHQGIQGGWYGILLLCFLTL